VQLRRAYEMFHAMGAEGFAERAHRELLATGQIVRRQVTEASSQLSAQELQVAVRARGGYTNPEIADELFLSPRTVEWHLHKVFMKLGITSRRQLSTAFPDQELHRHGRSEPFAARRRIVNEPADE
jgi:DNA-binding CsgD family transcriptional regulator